MNDFKLLVLNFLLRILFKFRSHSRGLREQPDEKQLCLSVIVQNETVGISALGSRLARTARKQASPSFCIKSTNNKVIQIIPLKHLDVKTYFYLYHFALRSSL